MSHQTGITTNEHLRNFFGQCRSGDIRLIKVSVKNEELALDEFREAVGTFDEDYDRLILPLLHDHQPCYVFYRLDDKNDTGYQWLFLSWAPDDSPVREKMLYASTKATLKLEFGSGQIRDEMFGTTRDELSLKAYKKQREHSNEAAPLTFSEEELKQIRKNEITTDVGIDSRQATIQGIAFPIADDVISALFQLKDGSLNYVQMSIDLEKEEINLEQTTPTDITQLPRRVPSDKARYHLFSFPHTHEGDYQESIVFIYSMPGYSCSVKERMLYSSCISPLVDVIENKIQIPVVKRIEVTEGKELTREFLTEEIHPTVNIVRQKFAKPKGPPNRGMRRMIRTKDENSQNDQSGGVFV